MVVETFAAVYACSVAIVGGAVLQAAGVSAGNGQVIDWRTVRSGESVQQGGDPFDTAQLFVSLVGADAAIASVELGEVAGVLPVEAPAPRITAFMPAPNGGRRRCFDVGAFTVLVEPSEDDAAQAAFTARLAALAGEAVRTP